MLDSFYICKVGNNKGDVVSVPHEHAETVIAIKGVNSEYKFLRKQLNELFSKTSTEDFYTANTDMFGINKGDAVHVKDGHADGEIIVTRMGKSETKLTQRQLYDMYDKLDTDLFNYKRSNRLSYLWGKENDLEEFYFKAGKSIYSKDRVYLFINRSRSQYEKFCVEVLARVAKVRYLTEEVYFNAHKTINTAIETLVVYFDRLEDAELDIEVNRMITLAKELENLSNQVLSSSDSAVNKMFMDSLDKHRLLVDSAIDALKKINNN